MDRPENILYRSYVGSFKGDVEAKLREFRTDFYHNPAADGLAQTAMPLKGYVLADLGPNENSTLVMALSVSEFDYDNIIAQILYLEGRTGDKRQRRMRASFQKGTGIALRNAPDEVKAAMLVPTDIVNLWGECFFDRKVGESLTKRGYVLIGGDPTVN